jgi:hypothetical protein
MVMITILLDALCRQGLGVVSWIIVFIPFVMMTIITSYLLYIFGLNSTTGVRDQPHECDTENIFGKGIYTNKNGDIIVYDPYYDNKNYPVYYNSPNIIIPAPQGIHNYYQKQKEKISQKVNTSTDFTTYTKYSYPSLSNFFNTTSPSFNWS